MIKDTRAPKWSHLKASSKLYQKSMKFEVSNKVIPQRVPFNQNKQKKAEVIDMFGDNFKVSMDIAENIGALTKEKVMHSLGLLGVTKAREKK